MADEWLQLSAGLKTLGICREVHYDRFMWSDKLQSRNVLVADIYDKMCEVDGGYLPNPILYDRSKCHIPCKIICFSWLIFHIKNFTGENLKKRKWHGPSICVICKQEEENNVHLFLKCQYVSPVWGKLAVSFDFPYIQFHNVAYCMRWCHKQKPAWRIIPILVF